MTVLSSTETGLVEPQTAGASATGASIGQADLDTFVHAPMVNRVYKRSKTGQLGVAIMVWLCEPFDSC